MNSKLIEMFIEKLDHLTVSDHHGLRSPGLTCYLNTVLQLLFMTEDFRDSIKRCCSKDSTNIDALLKKLFYDLERGFARTHRLTKKLGIVDMYEQRDAAEYFEKILCLTRPEASKIFKGELNHKTTCGRCKTESDSRGFFWILPLPMEDSNSQTYTVKQGLTAFFRKDKVCGENRMYCTECDQKHDAHLECEMTQNPEILTLLLKRFTFDYKCRHYVKLHCQVEVPQTLHMKDCKYDLYALVNHYGNLTGGHYTAVIQSFETGAWYCFNDDIVSKVKPLFGSGNGSLRSDTAYILLYRKDAEAERRHNKAEGGEAPGPQGGGCESNIRHLKTSSEYSTSEQTQCYQSKRLQREDITWDKTGSSPRVEPSESKRVKNKREVAAERNLGGKDTVKPCQVPPVHYSYCKVNGPAACGSSPPLRTHSGNLKRNEGEGWKREATQTGSAGDCKRKTKHAKKSQETITRPPWR